MKPGGYALWFAVMLLLVLFFMQDLKPDQSLAKAIRASFLILAALAGAYWLLTLGDPQI